MESSSCDKMGYENTRVRIITVTWSRQLCATVAVGANAFDGCVAPSVLPGCCWACHASNDPTARRANAHPIDAHADAIALRIYFNYCI